MDTHPSRAARAVFPAAVFLIATTTAAIVTGCSPSGLQGKVVKLQASRADFGPSWPFTVEKGELACINGSQLVFIADGNSYAMNDAAVNTRKFKDVDAIHAYEPGREQEGVKVSLTDFTEKGRELCQRRS